MTNLTHIFGLSFNFLEKGFYFIFLISGKKDFIVKERVVGLLFLVEGIKLSSFFF
jgi:hypothetical protein